MLFGAGCNLADTIKNLRAAGENSLDDVADLLAALGIDIGIDLFRSIKK
ncbi:MAG: hypothetical protein RL735_22, partial [Pseudomonadota bacterium]